VNEGTASVNQILCKLKTFLLLVITGDGSWIYGFNLEKKQQSS
jgi:hypothetical protein